jgi:hypothetical protein
MKKIPTILFVGYYSNAKRRKYKKVHCRNPNIGFATKCGMKQPMRPRKCV